MPRENLVGQTIAGYSLQSEVGEGGTSAVFRAQHADHGTVAVKVLREKLRQDRTAVARFLREARYGERVQHPNVVRTIEIGEAGPGMHFLAIEWAAGEILEKYAKRQGPLPADEVCTIVRQIADAVQRRARGRHRPSRSQAGQRDVRSGRRAQVKLLDFGIATDTDISPEQRLTRAGFFVGTLMYVAPEALSGELVGPLADQYSLATIAYFLLTSCLPFPAKTPREMFSQLLSQPPIPLNQAKAGLRFPPALEAVVMRGLSKDPAKRYPDVLALASDFCDATVARQPDDEKRGLGVEARIDVSQERLITPRPRRALGARRRRAARDRRDGPAATA